VRATIRVSSGIQDPFLFKLWSACLPYSVCGFYPPSPLEIPTQFFASGMGWSLYTGPPIDPGPIQNTADLPLPIFFPSLCSCVNTPRFPWSRMRPGDPFMRLGRIWRFFPPPSIRRPRCVFSTLIGGPLASSGRSGPSYNGNLSSHCGPHPPTRGPGRLADYSWFCSLYLAGNIPPPLHLPGSPTSRCLFGHRFPSPTPCPSVRYPIPLPTHNRRRSCPLNPPGQSHPARRR